MYVSRGFGYSVRLGQYRNRMTVLPRASAANASENALASFEATAYGGGAVQALAVDPTNAQVVYAGSTDGIFKTTNGGSSWSRVDGALLNIFGNPRSVVSLAVKPDSPCTVYAGVDTGFSVPNNSARMIVSTDCGATWGYVSGLPLGRSTSSLVFTNATPSTLYFNSAVNSQFGTYAVYRTTPTGFEFSSPVAGNAVIATDPGNPCRTYAGNVFGEVKMNASCVAWAWTDFGTLPAAVSSLAAHPTDQATVLAGTIDGGLYRRVGPAGSWSLVRNLTPPVRAIAYQPSNPAVVVAAAGHSIYTSVDGGATWVPSSTFGGVVGALASAPSAPATLYAGGDAFVERLTQGAPCSYQLTTGSANAPANASAESVGVLAAPGCAWTATSSVAWMSVTAAGSGAGPGTVTYAVQANPGASDRVGTLNIAGMTFTVTQAGAGGCTYHVAPTVLNPAPSGSAGTLTVTTTAGCGWTATSHAVWVTIISGANGTSSGSVGYVVASNPTTSPRASSLTVAGQTVTVTQAGTTSSTTPTYYLSEGATGDLFDLDIAIANPNGTAAPVRLRFLKPDGSVVTQTLTVEAQARTTIRVDTVPGVEASAVSTVVESTGGLPLLVERTMQWDGTHYGGHGDTAASGPSQSWFFAEGFQGFFDTYVLLANASTTPTTATVTFLREGETPVVKSVPVAATSRVNVYAGAYPELLNRSFSIVVTADAPIIAERAMYWSGGGRFWIGGHESAGVTAPATNWFHAEGATGPYFDTYILLGNPNAQPATATLTYLLSAGTTVTRVKTIPANERLTVNLELEDPSMASAAVSTTVASDLPIISERAMYWPGESATWTEAHGSFGVTATATRWGLGEGRVGGPEAYETYILLANPSPTTATVQLTFLRTAGAPVTKTVSVPPTSRFNVWVNGDLPLANESFGTVIEVQNGVPIAVERAMYWDANGQHWAGGTNATAVPLPSYRPPVLALTAVAPAAGPATGGTPVTLTGSGFVGGATVTVGGQAAGNVVVTGASTITATTPASATLGARAVTVTTPGGSSVTLPTAFTYTAAVTGVATVTFKTTAETCRCTEPIGGVLSNLRVDGATLGTMGCAEPSRSFSVTPGVHTVQACDSVECWPAKTQTIASGDEYIYTATCQ